MKHLFAILTILFLFQEHSVSQNKNNDIVTNDSIANIYDIDEIVVIGYGEEKKRDLTGAISSLQIKEHDLLKGTQSVESVLSGKIPGLRIIKSTGDLDANTSIVIRGGNSITQDNTPLFIVDGFPVENLNDIPTSAIKSIDILKDAAATAIYGAQGGNGVIIITTKQSNSNKLSIDYNTFVGFRKLAKKLNVLSPYDYARLQYENTYLTQDNLDDYTKYFGDFKDIDIYKSIEPISWQDKIFGRTAFFNHQNIELKGKTKSLDYKTDYTFEKHNGIMLGSEKQSHNIGFTANQKIKSKTKLHLDARFGHNKSFGAGTASDGTTTTSRLRNCLQYAPFTFAFVNKENDDYENNANVYDPIAVTNDDYKQSTTNSFRFNLGSNVKITSNDALQWNSSIGGWWNNKETDRAYGAATSQARNYGGLPLATTNNEKEHKLRETSSLTYDILENNRNNNLKLMVGEELIEYNDKYLKEEARYFPEGTPLEQAVKQLGLGILQPKSKYTAPADRTFSVFSRLTYENRHKYIMNVSLRSDRSSKFALGKQWGTFPAAALAWRFSDEKFLSRTSNWLSDGKFRVSYGATGNNKIKNSLYQLVYNNGIGNYNMVYFNESSQKLLTTLSTLPNPNLTWENDIKRNIGLDLTIFKNTVFTIESYYNSTKNLLISSSIATESGYSSMMENIGETSNRGLEIAINSTLYDKNDWKIYFGANIAFNKNRIEKLGKNTSTLISSGWAGSEITSDYILKEKHPTGQMYGFVTDGYYTIDQFIYNEEKGTYTLKEGEVSDKEILSLGNNFGPGCLKLKDIDNDGIITENDKQIIGNANPKAIGGFNFTINYKNWDFGVDAYWSYGNKIYNANKIESTSTNKYKLRNLTNEMSSSNRWTYFDDSGNYITTPDQLQILNSEHNIWSPIIGRYVFHSWAVEDGSFLRIDKITLGYTLSNEQLVKKHIQSLRIYSCVDNAFCFTKYSGFDPEVNTRNSTPLTPNVDYSAYPRSRAYTLGLNIRF